MKIANMPMNTVGSSSFGRVNGDAFVKLLDSVHYARDAFEQGLSVAGCSIRRSPAMPPKAGDVLVLWNRYDSNELLARAYEAAGATVLITENAWLGPDKDGHYFALCRGHHNGAGDWYVGQNTRSNVLDMEFRPWRKSGEHIVLLPQRGMGEAGVRMPPGWELNVMGRLSRITKRPIVTRVHPGVRPHPKGMPELEGAWCAVTWASGAAIKAICLGIPVFYEFPKWIGADAARFGIANIEAPYMGPRGTMLRKLSWAMWTVDEIRSGEPFRCLLS